MAYSGGPRDEAYGAPKSPTAGGRSAPYVGASYQQSGYPVQAQGGYPVQAQGGYPVQAQGGYPVQAQGGYPMQGYPVQGAYPVSNPVSYGQPAYAGQGVPSVAYVQPQAVFSPDVSVTVGGDNGSKFLDQMDRTIRMGFIRKVYLILSLQLTLTFGMVAAFTFSDDLRRIVQSSPGFLWSAIALSFGTLIAISCCPGVAKSYPTNVLCLALFTLAEGYLVGVIASTYTTDSVLIAVGACVLITLGLTAFAWQTKVDFTAMSSSLFCIILVFLLFGIYVAIFPSRLLRTLYAAIAVLIFSLFIVYDTQLIIGGSHHSHRFELDDYVFAALNLYLDIINLFLQLLKLFGERR